MEKPNLVRVVGWTATLTIISTAVAVFAWPLIYGSLFDRCFASETCRPVLQKIPVPRNIPSPNL